MIPFKRSPPEKAGFALNQINLIVLRDAMVQRAVKAIQRSDALLERTRQVLRQAEMRAAKHDSTKATSVHATDELKA